MFAIHFLYKKNDSRKPTAYVIFIEGACMGHWSIKTPYLTYPLVLVYSQLIWITPSMSILYIFGALKPISYLSDDGTCWMIIQICQSKYCHILVVGPWTEWSLWINNPLAMVSYLIYYSALPNLAIGQFSLSLE